MHSSPDPPTLLPGADKLDFDSSDSEEEDDVDSSVKISDSSTQMGTPDTGNQTSDTPDFSTNNGDPTTCENDSSPVAVTKDLHLMELPDTESEIATASPVSMIVPSVPEIEDPDNALPEINMDNLQIQVVADPHPIHRIHKNHPLDNIIGSLNSGVQTRSQTGAINVCKHVCFLSSIQPKAADIALRDPSWVSAMQEELRQFEELNVWELVECPKGKRPIGTKWVFKNKEDKDGVVIQNKARLVVQGFRQIEGIDYDEIFAPVARLEAVRIFLAYASYIDFKVYQLDVKAAFLYGTVQEEIYVCQPDGFVDPEYPDRVYKLNKALYGLHQAPRAWYERLVQHLTSNGYSRGTIDKTLFIKKTDKDQILVQVYVDDIIFGSTNEELVREFEEVMLKEFKMSKMGLLSYFLGIQVEQKAEGTLIHQGKYVQDLLTKFNMEDSKSASTPMESRVDLTPKDADVPVDEHQYRGMIGSLLYLTHTRPDIMFAVCKCARYQSGPMTPHLVAVKRIFRYIKGNPRFGLWYPKDSPFDLCGYSDSDHGGCALDRKSTSGGCQFLGNRLVSWQCKKQSTVSTSTAEAEYVAASSCCSQLLWIQFQLLDYGLHVSKTPLYMDNTAALAIVKNPVEHSKAKHIQIRYHFIRDSEEKEYIKVTYVETKDQFADLFTKPFDATRFNSLCGYLGMITFPQ